MATSATGASTTAGAAVVDASGAAGREKAERMKAYLEERYERLRRDREEERTRRADLEETMVRCVVCVCRSGCRGVYGWVVGAL